MKPIHLILVGLAVVLCLTAFETISPNWGFYGHRKINRMAVFTLPPGLIGFYKTHIEFITEHAVDPDKRRYATKHEAVRHYIDVDHWGEYPFNNVPRVKHEAYLQFADFLLIEDGDTSIYLWPCQPSQLDSNLLYLPVSCDSTYQFFKELIDPIYYEDEQIISQRELRRFIPADSDLRGSDLKFVDHFSGYGILPYHLKDYYARLVYAFTEKDVKRILRISAEIGHYIGDAHVPLHTTENYNGQFTNQIGIHAFWESRLPELFADDIYDFFVGRAEYVDDVGPYFWDVVLKSHSYLAAVLDNEKELSILYPQDQQYCFEERLEQSVLTQCTEYAGAYHKSLDGMVEIRMQDAVLSIGSIWYSAWIDAGSPDLPSMQINQIAAESQDSLDLKFKNGKLFGRDHTN